MTDNIEIGSICRINELAMFYPDYASALFDFFSVQPDHLDVNRRCRELSRYLKKPISYLRAKSLIVILSKNNDCYEVLCNDKKGWVNKRDLV